MTHRERVLRTFQFQKTDRIPYDLMEGVVWQKLLDYFREKNGIDYDGNQVLDLFDTDFRWIGLNYQPPKPPTEQITPPVEPKVAEEKRIIYSRPVSQGPLADARTIADVESYKIPDPSWWQPGDYAEARRRWQDHALVFVPGWMPLFWTACEAFGMEGALIKMISEPKIFEAFVKRQHEFYMDILKRGVKAAQGIFDICWLGDDFSSQESTLMNPDLWRKYIKPYLAEQVQLAREHDLYVIYHSCGAVRPVLNDLIEIGVNCMLVFQTTAKGMDAESIAAEFGGRLAFYGGIDIQQLLSYGTVDDVKARVYANIKAFENYGGYIVANSHHMVDTIKGENINAMYEAARTYQVKK
jgi:uroporphyrinogen decarboxylase